MLLVFSVLWWVVCSEFRVCIGWESIVVCRIEVVMLVGLISGIDSVVMILLVVSFFVCICLFRYMLVCVISRFILNVD